jgi:hypothetical protein
MLRIAAGTHVRIDARKTNMVYSGFNIHTDGLPREHPIAAQAEGKGIP